jgi:hypothetical protein
MGEFQWRGTPCPTSKHAEANPIVSDLTSHRWHGPILTRDEELELARRSQAGDGDATRSLLERFHRKVLKIASGYHGPPFEERVAVGMAELLKAIAAFDPARGFRLATVVGKYVGLGIWTFVRSYSRKWPTLVSLSSVKPESPERSDRDGERWETWVPRRVGYRKPYGIVNWWQRPPSWVKYSNGVKVVSMRVMEPVQRLLKRIGRLYRQACDTPWRGTFQPWSNHVLLGGVELRKLPAASTPAVRTLPTTDVKKKACFRQQPCEFCDPKAYKLALLERNIIDASKDHGRNVDAVVRNSLHRAVNRAERPAARPRKQFVA